LWLLAAVADMEHFLVVVAEDIGQEHFQYLPEHILLLGVVVVRVAFGHLQLLLQMELILFLDQ